VVSQIQAKKIKLFTDEFLNACVVAVSELMFPERQTADISVSRFIVCRRTDNIAGTIEKSLINTLRTFRAYSLALDESTGSGDTAQPTILFEVSMVILMRQKIWLPYKS
jgi:hypothetical protein